MSTPPTTPLTPAERKKAIELEDLHFARLLRPDLFPPGEYEEDQDEKPDIVVCGPGWRYGVEVTGMTNKPEKAQEGVRAEVSWKAQALTASLMGCYVTVAFRLDKFIGDQRERNWLAEKLAAFVLAEVEQRDLAEKWLVELRQLGPELTPWASSVFIHNLPGSGSTTWHSGEVWGSGPLLPKDIRDRIAAKEGKLAEYRRRAPRVVLLLVISGVSGAETSHMPPITRQATYRTNFDAVVLLDRMNAEAIELDVAPIA